MQARPRLVAAVWDCLLGLLVEHFEQTYPGHARWGDFRLLALDGTALRMRHWPALAVHFGTASGGRGRPTPMARVVLLQLPLARLPVRCELAPWRDSETAVARRLLAGLRPDDLVLMDRGFWSYGLFWQVQQQGAFFATRLKARVGLRTLRRLGPGDRLVEHAPKDWRKSWQKQGLPPSIRLRVIDYHLPGFRPSAVLTDLLDDGRVSAAEWVRLATADEAGRVIEAGLYHRRWQAEICHPRYPSSDSLYHQRRAA